MNNYWKRKNLHALGLYKGLLLNLKFWGKMAQESSEMYCLMSEIPLDAFCGKDTQDSLQNLWELIQEKLNKLGYSLSVDGLCGEKTDAAIKDFRSSYWKPGTTLDEEALARLYEVTEEYITEHVSLEDIACACKGAYCNGFNGMTRAEAARVAKPVAEIFEKGYALIQERYPMPDGSERPVYIRSGIRCEKQNEKVGSSEGSYHLKGIALDVDADGISSSKIWDEVNPNGGVGTGGGRYPHIDSRGKRARWFY